MHESGGNVVLVSRVFWFQFVVRVVLTNHVRAGFGCMQVSRLRGELKRWNAPAPHWLSPDRDLALDCGTIGLYGKYSDPFTCSLFISLHQC